MTKKEFITECFNRGICRKSRAINYTKNKPKDYDYADKDFEAVFSFDDILSDGYRDWAAYRSGDDTAGMINYQPRLEHHTPIRRREVKNID